MDWLEIVADIAQILSLASLIVIYWQIKETNKLEEDAIDVEAEPDGQVILTNRSKESLKIIQIQQIRYCLYPDPLPEPLTPEYDPEPQFSNQLIPVNHHVSTFKTESDLLHKFKNAFYNKVRELLKEAETTINRKSEILEGNLVSELILYQNGSMSLPGVQTMGLAIERFLGIIIVLWIHYHPLNKPKNKKCRVFVIFWSYLIEPNQSWLTIESKYLGKY